MIFNNFTNIAIQGRIHLTFSDTLFMEHILNNTSEHLNLKTVTLRIS